MSVKTTIVKSYVKQVLAFVKGDKDEAIAARNLRIIASGCVSQIGTLGAQKVQAEEAVILAEERLEKCKLSIVDDKVIPVNDSSAYFRDIRNYQEQVDDAKEKLENIEKSIIYFQEFQKKIEA